jgi:hypothetical protein
MNEKTEWRAINQPDAIIEVKNGAVPLTPRLAIEPIRIRRMASKGVACAKNRFFPRRTKTINAL